MKMLYSILLVLSLWASAQDFSPQVFAIANRLRCPVCSGETAGESNSDMALEFRNIIAEQLQQGQTEAQIIEYFHGRYGDWILTAPPKTGMAGLVWLAPVLGLGGLAWGLWRYHQQTTRVQVSPEALAAKAKALEEQP